MFAVLYLAPTASSFDDRRVFRLGLREKISRINTIWMWPVSRSLQPNFISSYALQAGMQMREERYIKMMADIFPSTYST